jgi:hypothetical protein
VQLYAGDCRQSETVVGILRLIAGNQKMVDAIVS